MILADKVAVAADVAGVSDVLLLSAQTLATQRPEFRVVLLIPGRLATS
jgi:hypothetical protein